MPTLAMNKSSLKHERDRLRIYERFLPSLDLKRRQLIAEFVRERAALRGARRDAQRYAESLKGLFELMGSLELDLSELVRVGNVEIVENNVLGVRLPMVSSVQFERGEYSTLANPFWVDDLVHAVEQVADQRVRIRVREERVGQLERAVRRITQRVNLFEKVLIPTARQNIQRIHIHLDDAARAAVVRSKIAKAKRHTVPQGI